MLNTLANVSVGLGTIWRVLPRLAPLARARERDSARPINRAFTHLRWTTPQRAMRPPGRPPTSSPPLRPDPSGSAVTPAVLRSPRSAWPHSRSRLPPRAARAVPPPRSATPRLSVSSATTSAPASSASSPSSPPRASARAAWMSSRAPTSIPPSANTPSSPTASPAAPDVRRITCAEPAPWSNPAITRSAPTSSA